MSIRSKKGSFFREKFLISILILKIMLSLNKGGFNNEVRRNIY
mgnify:FL=1